MHSPEVAKSRRRSWQEIAAYYEEGAQGSGLHNWAKLRDFARLLESKPYADGLVSVGTLGCILVFKDPDCVAERGYFLIASSPTDERDRIHLGFFTSQQYDPAKLIPFIDAESAIHEFEKRLTERGFISHA